MTGPSDFIGVIADDLTGGAAIGGEIARMGHLVDVVEFGRPIQPTRSIVLETGSRYIPPGLAAKRVKDAARFLADAGSSVVMKKIDSTLKGNVAAELAAFSTSCPGRLLIAPACPEVGLTIRQGGQFTPSGPGTNVLDLLATTMGGPLAALDLGTVRRGSDEVAKWLRRNPHGTVLADSETDADIAAVVAGAAESGIVSFGGTYGLGAALAATFLGSGTAGRFVPHAVDGMIVAAGSASTTTVKQLAHLVAAGAEEIVLDMDSILTGNAEAEAQRAAGHILASAAKLFVVHTAPQRTGEAVSRHCARLGWNERDLADLLAIPFARALQAAPGYAAYFIGGETTGGVFERLGLESLIIQGECSPAVPFAESRTSSQWPLILTKPGAFGADDTLTKTARMLLGDSRGLTPRASEVNHSSGIH